MINTASTNATHIISSHDFVQVIENTSTKQRSLHALTPVKKDAVICKFYASQVLDSPSYLTLQVGVRQHITLLPEFLQYSNHSCDPNIFFNPVSMEILALKDIEVNEEFTFFYPSTEYDMAQPFLCYCGSGNCLQNIKGAKYLSIVVLEKYRLSDFIKEQLQIN